MKIKSKLPNVGTTIFTIMSALAQEHNAINLSQGFPDFDVDQKLKDLINYYVQNGYNQYAPMSGVLELRRAIRNKKQLLYGIDLNPESEITITNGATEAIFSTITALVNKGDEVIIFEPAYDCYVPAIELCGGIPVPIKYTFPSFTIDWNEVEHAITSKTRMIIINTPHNPSGSVLNKEDIATLEHLTDKTNILVLSDEVYQHLIYDGLRHESVFYYPNLYSRSIISMSFGKTFHATGWRIGYVIAPPELTSEIRKVHQYNTFSINRPLQHALAQYLEDPEHFLTLPSFYQEKRDLFTSLISDSKFDLLPCNGTYFMLASFDRISKLPDQDFARWLTKTHGVAVIPMSSFYSNQTDNKIIRFCFAKKEETLITASELINAV